MSWLAGIIASILALFAGNIGGQTILYPQQGGTGISSVTTTDIGKALTVSSTNPLVYKFASSTGGSGVPGGSSTQIQYNNNGAFAGSSTFTFNSSTGQVGINSTSPTAQLGIQGIANSNPVLDIASSTGASLLRILANGKVGIGTTTPQATLSVMNSSIPATNTFAFITTDRTSTPLLSIDNLGNVYTRNSGLYYEASSSITYATSLSTGPMNFDNDAGLIQWIDLPFVSTTIPAGTPEGYTASLSGWPMIYVYGEANGSGGLANQSISINTSTTSTAKMYIDALGALALSVNGSSTVSGNINSNGTYTMGGVNYGQYFISTSGYANNVLMSSGSGHPFWTTTSSLLVGGGGGSGTVNSGTAGQLGYYSASGNTISPTSTIDATVDVAGILPIANGGTNSSTLAGNGSVIYSDGTRFNSSGVGTFGYLLESVGAGTPVWVNSTSIKLDAGNIVSGVLSIARGGTNSSTIAGNGSIVYTDGTRYQASGVGTSGQLLQSGGAGVPTWITMTSSSMGFASSTHTHDASAIISGTFPIARGGTNSTTIAGNGSVIYSDGTEYNASGVGTLGYFLMSSGAGTPVWVNSSTFPGATGVVGSGTAGQMPYYAVAGTTLAPTSAMSLANSGMFTAPLINTIVYPDGTRFAQTLAGVNSSTNYISSGEVMLPQASYTGVKMIDITANHSLVGVGNNSSILSMSNTANTNTIQLEGSNILLRDFGISGNKTNQSSNGDGVKTNWDANYLFAENLYLNNTYGNGMNINGDYASKVFGNDISNSGAYGIEICSSEDTRVIGNYIGNASTSAIFGGCASHYLNNYSIISMNDIYNVQADQESGVHYYTGDQSIISNNIIHDMASTSHGNNGVFTQGDRMLVFGNLLQNITGTGVEMNAGSQWGFMNNNILTATSSGSAGQGVYIGGSGTSNVTVLGNVLTNHSQHGIYVDVNTTGTVISENVIGDALPGRNLDDMSAIRLHGANTNTRIINNTVWGVNNTHYGVYFDGSAPAANSIEIWGNDWSGMTSGTIYGLTLASMKAMEVDTGLNVVSGTVTFPAQLATGGGNYLCWNAGTVTQQAANCTVSSERYKTNIQNIPDPWNELSQLNPVSFNWKTNPDGSKEYGFIAEQVDKIDKNLVIYNASNTPESVKYDNIIPLLVKEVQDLHSQVQELQNEKKCSVYVFGLCL